jgi:transcription-repair coupling factor (superfamily II helicase)
VEALIPSFYIPDSDEKISVYQKLAGSEDEATLGEFEKDLVDEYGELPKQVQNLFGVLRLKLACRKAGVIRVKAEDMGRIGSPSTKATGSRKDVVLNLGAKIEAMDIMRLLQVNPQWKISGSTLRIDERELVKRAGSDDYVDELTEEIKKLIKTPKEKKAKAAAAEVE